MIVDYLYEMAQILKNIPMQILNIHEKPHVVILGEMIFYKNLN